MPEFAPVQSIRSEHIIQTESYYPSELLLSFKATKSFPAQKIRLEAIASSTSTSFFYERVFAIRDDISLYNFLEVVMRSKGISGPEEDE
jgi:hypothetical protein